MLIIAIAVGLVGLFVGSFLDVVVNRLHAGRDFVQGRSECDHCKRELRWFELIPVASWVLQGGRCRHCHKRLRWEYPAVELITAVLFGLSTAAFEFHTYGDIGVFLLWLYVLGSMIVLAVYDVKWYLLPDKVLLPLIAPAAAIIIGEALTQRSLMVALGPVLAALLFGGAFYSLAAVSKGKWMGGGDIKLAFVMGLLLGLQRTSLAMLVAFNSAAIVGVALLLAHRKRSRDVIPFGPFLIGGTIVAYLWGDQIIAWYLNVSGLGTLG
jgi:prepilin signal peptidase PulO-like enzyme (type II secretory pathway)